MNTMTVSGFRRNMAAAFNKAAEGENVMVRRGTQVFAIVPVSDDELTITPELQAKIDKARAEIKAGKCVTLKSHEDIDKYFDSL
jgi:antitoxin (DNA-binding transcriptional repressor) of toxin-antitoxin stability system